MQNNPDPLIGAIPTVTISPKGLFKYILITAQVESNGSQTTVNFVRGSDQCEYHMDNFQQFFNEVKAQGFVIKKKNLDNGNFTVEGKDSKINFSCPGGGRIEHNQNGKKCFIYGYSKSFGRVEHSIAHKLISQALGYPMQEITTSQEGY